MSDRRGLTLVELMVSLAIISLLTGASLAVVSRLAQADRTADRSHREALFRAPLRDLLEADLLHATEVAATRDGFRVRTRLSLAGDTLEASHLAATVSYAVAAADPARPLLRSQENAEGKEAFSEVVCWNAEAIRLAPAGEPDRWIEMPAGVSVTVTFPDGREPAAYTIRRE